MLDLEKIIAVEISRKIARMPSYSIVEAFAYWLDLPGEGNPNIVSQFHDLTPEKRRIHIFCDPILEKVNRRKNEVTPSKK